MNINVVQLKSETICDVAYKCSHRETEIQTNNIGFFNPKNDSYEEVSQTIEVCLNPLCEAWRHLDSLSWEDDYLVEVQNG